MVHQAMVKGKLLSVKEKNKIAEKMRSSRKYFDESYTKRFQINPQPQAHPIKQEDNNIVYSSILYESNVPLSTKYQANLLASKFILAKQYPPVSLTSDSTLFSAQAYGNGTYITTSSSVTASYNPYKAANSAMSSKRFV